MTSQQRRLSVMFADIAGSSQLYERLGDTEAMHAIERCLKRMNRSIQSYRGRTIQVIGDELMAAFETAEDACHASIDMQQRVADLPPVSGLKLTIRIGLHTGIVTESADELTGNVVTSAARIVGAARRDQILCSSDLLAELGPLSALKHRPLPDIRNIEQDGVQLAISQIEWLAYPVAGQFSALSIMPVARLRVKFNDRAHLLDDKMRVLTMGRDSSNKIQVDDRKASRSHARIEKRNNGYFLVDTSTNGTFVSFEGHQEVHIRRGEILLDGNGRISFGTSRSDPTAVCADFEHL